MKRQGASSWVGLWHRKIKAYVSSKCDLYTRGMSSKQPIATRIVFLQMVCDFLVGKARNMRNSSDTAPAPASAAEEETRAAPVRETPAAPVREPRYDPVSGSRQKTTESAPSTDSSTTRASTSGVRESRYDAVSGTWQQTTTNPVARTDSSTAHAPNAPVAEPRYDAVSGTWQTTVSRASDSATAHAPSTAQTPGGSAHASLVTQTASRHDVYGPWQTIESRPTQPTASRSPAK